MATLAGEYDFTIEQGVGFNLVLTYRNPNNADGSPGSLIDLTGYTSHLQARPFVGATEVLIDLSTANGGIVLGGAAGTVTLQMTAAATTALSFNTAAYDIKLVPPVGEPDRFVEGTVTLSPGVTV